MRTASKFNYNQFKWKAAGLFLAGMLCFGKSFAQGFDKTYRVAKSAVGATSFNVVTANKKYDGDYGFDLESEVEVTDGDKAGAPVATSAKPFYFSAAVPDEGNYLVTLKLVGGKNPCTGLIKTENRRLMVQSLQLQPGEIKSVAFAVNIRRPGLQKGGMVKLNPREIGSLEWDEKLTLEFCGGLGVSEISIKKVTDRVTVYLAGNSTVVNQPSDPFTAWGQIVTRFFKSGVAVANHAESGLALSSFKAQNRLEKILELIKPGDYLFIEFGHNDQKETGAKAGAYLGYTERFKEYINLTRARGGLPVVVTSTARRKFNEQGQTENTLGDYPAAARAVARELNVPLIDLNEMTTIMYNAWGPDFSKKAFVFYPANMFAGRDKVLQDNTHFNPYGAYEVAKCVLLGIQKNGLPLKDMIVDGFKFSPDKPDPLEVLDWQMKYDGSFIKPAGN